MKKKIIALVTALVLIASCVFVLSSCRRPKPDDGSTDGNDPVLDLDEGVTDGAGSGDVTMITDPNNPEAGADVEDKYVHG